MAFVLDCSVAMAWCFEDETDGYADWLLGTLDAVETVLVPSIWPIEMANVLVVGERRRRLSGIDTAQFLRLLDRLPIEVDARSPYKAMQDVLAVARDYGISAYDACYIELAIRTKLPLATLDSALRKVATRLGLIKVHSPAAKR